MARTIALLLSAAALSACSGLYGHDEFSNYTQRKDTLTLGAGDAKAQNMTTHANSYWPRYVGDRNLEQHGERAAKAVECYRGGPQAKQPVTTSQTNVTPTGGAQTNSQTKSQC